ncbi:MAG: DUF4395 domain-containing protein [Mycobacteriales bacterium]|nr:DUF4395 domain-containing protein [Frankia sp.]
MSAPSVPTSYVDPRGPRFGAAVTSIVLALALVTGSAVVVGLQAVVFLVGAVAGLRYAPYGRVFAVLKRVRRLAPPAELEAEAPPRFAQAVGAAFAVVGTLGFVAGATAIGFVATALALVAALLNAVFGLCLGCEIYLLARRTLHRAELIRFVTPSNKGAAA